MSVTTRSSTRQLLFGSGLLAIAGSIASADVFEVESFHVGAFYSTPAGGMPLIPDNDIDFQTCFMGHTTVSGFTTTERRTFFGFELADLVIPDGHSIVSVSFELELVGGGLIANFADGFEDVVFTSTTSDYATFVDPMGSGISLDEIFDSMGSGDEYTGVTIDAITPPGTISMDMSPDAIEDIMESMVDDSPFMMTGRLATYDPDPGALFEFVFGLSDVVDDGMPTGFPVPKLIITTEPVPAPSCLVLLAGGLMIGNRRRR
tara:strand:- start:18692 stop:19474 length:783 start_codon:yes stop_codon:yes gene_type:complete